MNIFATVDIGTNSVLLLIAKYIDEEIFVAEYESCHITRLGEGVDKTGQLNPNAINRTLLILHDISKKLDQFKVTKRAAIGTSVLRDAKNSLNFIEPASSILKCRVEIITGKREAQLVLIGVSKDNEFISSKSSLLFDVGGGSTEFIFFENKNFKEQKKLSLNPSETMSLPLGAVRFTERYIKEEPTSYKDLRLMRLQIQEYLGALSSKWQANNFIGIGGTVTTLAAVAQEMNVYEPNRINGFQLTLKEISRQLELYCRLPLEKRQEISGLQPDRADIILAGTVIISEILKYFNTQKCFVLNRGIRWGRIYELAEENQHKYDLNKE